MICEIKHYQQLSVDELYRVIQLRIEGFIVQNKVCYQDLEDKYDKHQYYMMWYENGVMIGVNALCYKKKFKGDNGEIYKYPAFRRQAWMPQYKGGCTTRDLIEGKKFCMKTWGSPRMMLEITYEGGKQPFLDFGFKEVGTTIDSASRKNWIFVYEPDTY
jgi:ElaA protein